MARLEKINRDGYHVKVQWECEFHNDCIAQPTVCKSPLCTRDALYGSRTEPMRPHYKAREGEALKCVDVISLYPYICKYFNFVVGHPVIHVGDSCKEKETCLRKEVLMKCSIVHPERLYHPVLPFRANKKLMFSICRTSVLTSNTGVCCHKTDVERALTGTWVNDEKRLAVQKGYRILEIHVSEYNVTRYDPETPDGGLFTDNIDTFLKLKAEAIPSEFEHRPTKSDTYNRSGRVRGYG